MGRKKKNKKKRISIISMFLLLIVISSVFYLAYRIVYADDIRWRELQESLKEINYPEQSDSLLPRTIKLII